MNVFRSFFENRRQARQQREAAKQEAALAQQAEDARSRLRKRSCHHRNTVVPRAAHIGAVFAAAEDVVLLDKSFRTATDDQVAPATRKAAEQAVREFAVQQVFDAHETTRVVALRLGSLCDDVQAELQAAVEAGLRPGQLLLSTSPQQLEEARTNEDLRPVVDEFDELKDQILMMKESAFDGLTGYEDSYSFRGWAWNTPDSFSAARETLRFEPPHLNGYDRLQERYMRKRLPVDDDMRPVYLKLLQLLEVSEQLVRSLAEELNKLVATRARQGSAPRHVTQLVNRTERLAAERAARAEMFDEFERRVSESADRQLRNLQASS